MDPDLVSRRSHWYPLCGNESRSRDQRVLHPGQNKAVGGRDVGSSAIKAVELKPAGRGDRVAAFACEPVPPHSIVDGAIIDGAAVSAAVRRLFENNAFKGREVAASLSGSAVIVKK